MFLDLLVSLIDEWHPHHDSAALSFARRFAVLPSAGHLTDAYLLALAAERQARFATFDQRIDTAWRAGGSRALVVLDHG